MTTGKCSYVGVKARNDTKTLGDSENIISALLQFNVTAISSMPSMSPDGTFVNRHVLLTVENQRLPFKLSLHICNVAYRKMIVYLIVVFDSGSTAYAFVGCLRGILGNLQGNFEWHTLVLFGFNQTMARTSLISREYLMSKL